MTGRELYEVWCRAYSLQAITDPQMRPWDQLLDPERDAWEDTAAAAYEDGQ